METRGPSGGGCFLRRLWCLQSQPGTVDLTPPETFRVHEAPSPVAMVTPSNPDPEPELRAAWADVRRCLASQVPPPRRCFPRGGVTSLDRVTATSERQLPLRRSTNIYLIPKKRRDDPEQRAPGNAAAAITGGRERLGFKMNALTRKRRMKEDQLMFPPPGTPQPLNTSSQEVKIKGLQGIISCFPSDVLDNSTIFHVIVVISIHRGGLQRSREELRWKQRRFVGVGGDRGIKRRPFPTFTAPRSGRSALISHR